MYVQSILAAKGTEVATIAPDATVRDAVALLNERRVGALVVSSDGRTIEGILSERDVVRGLGARSAAALDLSVADLMTREVTTRTQGHDRAADVVDDRPAHPPPAGGRHRRRAGRHRVDRRRREVPPRSARARTRPSTSTSRRAAERRDPAGRGPPSPRQAMGCFQRLR